jgi:hypothetical protein
VPETSILRNAIRAPNTRVLVRQERHNNSPANLMGRSRLHAPLHWFFTEQANVNDCSSFLASLELQSVQTARSLHSPDSFHVTTAIQLSRNIRECSELSRGNW